ncbi:MAG: SGNH/GDSL hydrolase family protein [Spirochaetales bacterium]|nr:SGNH/GDSL hydrolase family protein [Spirochaetales bacterium]
MKTILCFGDSNTWGYDPVGNSRHEYENRWPTVLQEQLGKEYLVVPEGLNGRTSVWEDSVEGDKNGSRHLVPCLESHKPLDAVILFLGVNDLKRRFSLSAWDIAAGVGKLVDMVRASGAGPGGSAPAVLVLVPPPLGVLSNFADMFAGAIDTSKKLAVCFDAMSAEKQVPCLHIDKWLTFTGADGIHFEKDQHKKLGSIVADKVKSVL